jgi:hypothetical protein
MRRSMVILAVIRLVAARDASPQVSTTPTPLVRHVRVAADDSKH